MEDTEMEKEIIKTGCRIYDRVIRRDGVDAEGKGYALLFTDRKIVFLSYKNPTKYRPKIYRWS